MGYFVDVGGWEWGGVPRGTRGEQERGNTASCFALSFPSTRIYAHVLQLGSRTRARVRVHTIDCVSGLPGGAGEAVPQL